MPVTGTIKNLVVGDDLDVSRKIVELPTDVTISGAWFTVKAKATDFDTEAFIQKYISEILATESGVITNDVANNSASLVFYLTHDETAVLQAATTYQYDIQLRTTAGKIYTPEVGTLTPIAGITTRSS